MPKIIIILFIMLNGGKAFTQYTFRGLVIKELTGKSLSFGDVYTPMFVAREGRIGTKVTQVDSQGKFNLTLKDSMNIKITIDCGLEGRVTKILTYNDTLIIFKLHTDCYDYNEEKALQDISRKSMYLLYNSIFSDTLTQMDKKFEKKYNIQYVNFTDTPIWMDCIREYNRIIAQYLDRTFGTIWRSEVRRTVQFD